MEVDGPRLHPLHVLRLSFELVRVIVFPARISNITTSLSQLSCFNESQIGGKKSADSVVTISYLSV